MSLKTRLAKLEIASKPFMNDVLLHKFYGIQDTKADIPYIIEFYKFSDDEVRQARTMPLPKPRKKPPSFGEFRQNGGFRQLGLELLAKIYQDR